MISEPSGATVKLSGCDFGSVVTTSLGSAACAAEQTSSAASDRTESRKLAFAGATTKARTVDKRLIFALRARLTAFACLFSCGPSELDHGLSSRHTGGLEYLNGSSC